MAESIISVLSAYLLGSFPSAYVIGRIVKGVDIREVGDGRIGTMAAIRRLGRFWGVVVAIMDFIKGTISIVIAQFVGVPDIVVLLAGLIAIVGHNWSIFLRFKGGRGAATIYGILAWLMIWQLIIAVIIMIIPYKFTRGSTYMLGIRRTTLFFGILLCIVSVLLYAESVINILPEPPWSLEISLILIVYPPFLLIPMLLKHT